MVSVFHNSQTRPPYGDHRARHLTIAMSRRTEHITMLADMRRARLYYEMAVSDWEADEEWLKTEYGSLAERLRRVGIG